MKRPRVPPVRFRDDPRDLTKRLWPGTSRRVHEVGGHCRGIVRRLSRRLARIRRVLNLHPRAPVPPRAVAGQIRGFLRVHHHVQVAHLVAVAPPRARDLRSIACVKDTRHANDITGVYRYFTIVDPFKQLRELRVPGHETHRGERVITRRRSSSRRTVCAVLVVLGPRAGGEPFGVDFDAKRVRVHSKRESRQRPGHRVRTSVAHGYPRLSWRECEPLRERHDGHRAVGPAFAEVHGEP